MSGITVRRKKSLESNKLPLSYYACNVRLQKKSYGRTCDNPYFRVDAVDAVVWQWVKGIFLDPERLREGLNRYQQAQTETLQPFYGQLESSEKSLASLRTEKERLIQAYSAGVLKSG